MRKFIANASLKIFVLLVTSFCALVSCLLLFFFSRDIDRNYSSLLEKEINARTLIQSIFTKRLDNYLNVYKIDKSQNIDTIQKYSVKWEKLSNDITSDFVKMKQFVPKDSLSLYNNLDDIIKKRAIIIQHTKDILAHEKENPSINIIDSTNTNYAAAYNESISTFLNNYNSYLLNVSKQLTQRTLKKSNIYLSILPIPLILLLIIFGYLLVLFLRDFSSEE